MTAGPASSGWLPSIEGVRAVAVGLVLCSHLTGTQGFISSSAATYQALGPLGNLGVRVFFVLSGFVIAASYGERLAHGYPRWRFMLIRLGRVYPLHIVTVALFVALELLVFRPVLQEAHPWSVLPRAVFLLDAFRTQTGDFFAPVSWAVGVELVLYACAAVLFGRGFWGRLRWLVTGR